MKFSKVKSVDFYAFLSQNDNFSIVKFPTKMKTRAFGKTREKGSKSQSVFLLSRHFDFAKFSRRL